MRYSVTHTPRDREGNVGVTKMIGIYRSLEMARGVGMAYAVPYHPGRNLRWSLTGPGTWCLDTSGGRPTHVMIAEVAS
jgi:hypothetical protein